MDVNNNGLREPWEPAGRYAGPDLIVTGSPTGVNLQLNDPVDADIDRMADEWEAAHGLNPSMNDAALDLDGDGLNNLAEYRSQTEVDGSDTDGDGATDGQELNTYGTNPILTDSDGDGMDDGGEIVNGLNPLINDASEDRDLDGLTNKEEYDQRANGYKANSVNSKAGTTGDDHQSDYRRLKGEGWVHRHYDKNDRLVSTERDNGVVQLYTYDGNSQKVRDVLLGNLDGDNDGLPDAWEFAHNLAFTGTNAATGNNGPQGDPDHDGFTNLAEWKAGTDPQDAASHPSNGGMPLGATLASQLDFVPTNWVMATGQVDGFGADSVVVGADGPPGVTANLLKIFRPAQSSWIAETIPLGNSGITSLALGVPVQGYGPSLYVGNRPALGAGTISELRKTGGGWSSPATVAVSDGTGSAHVVGLTPSGQLVSRLSNETNANSIFKQELSMATKITIPASNTWAELVSGTPDATGQTQLGADQQFARWSSVNGSQRALLKFKLPAGQGKIVGVTLKLKSTSLNTGEEVKIHKLNSASFTSAATWSKYDGVNSWTASGGDFSAAAMGTVPATSWLASGVNSINLDTTGIAWGSPLGIVIKRTTEATTINVGASWSSPSAPNAPDRPFLEITVIPDMLGNWSSPVVLDGAPGNIDWPTFMNLGAARWLDSGGIGCMNVVPAATPNAALGAVQWQTNGSWYFLTSGAATSWTLAEANAVSNGGHLATIDNAEENRWIGTMFPNLNPWIGLFRDLGSSRTDGWKWASGSDSIYRNWAAGEPNDTNGPNYELKTQLTSSGYWNDVTDAATLSGLVEVAPQFGPSVIPNPVAEAKRIWRGHAHAFGKLRSAAGIGNSLCFAYIRDKNGSSAVDSGDEFVVGEHTLLGTTSTQRTLASISLTNPNASGAYGLTVIAGTDPSKPNVLAMGEPDGTVSLWTAPDAVSPLVRTISPRNT